MSNFHGLTPEEEVLLKKQIYEKHDVVDPAILREAEEELLELKNSDIYKCRICWKPIDSYETRVFRNHCEACYRAIGPNDGRNDYIRCEADYGEPCKNGTGKCSECCLSISKNTEPYIGMAGCKCDSHNPTPKPKKPFQRKKFRSINPKRR